MEQAVLERLQELIEQAGPYLAEASELADRTGGQGSKLALALHRIRQESAEAMALILEMKRSPVPD
ncbi:MAG: hypothetical protein NUW06_04715 [Candidatus Acetothermia bacterium]|jgi:hypothetical protein|nr:hypothetical protein [Candidatus Acetothermia bacterium]MDH7505239.1 hypothetical protein [Candidatus Acetothermia bacterium]